MCDSCSIQHPEQNLPLEKTSHVHVQCVYLRIVKFGQWLNRSQQEAEGEWNGLSRV